MGMYQPTLEKLKEMTGQGNLAPVFRSINADLETPVSAYLKVGTAGIFRRNRRLSP